MKQPTWSVLPAAGEATILNVWNGSPTQFLLPLPSGAILWWVFDTADDEEHLAIAMALTEKEAQEVFDTPWTVGRIERVRATLADNRAMLIKRGQLPLWARFDIPRTGTEEEFIDELFAAIEQLNMEPLQSDTPVLIAATSSRPSN